MNRAAVKEFDKMSDSLSTLNAQFAYRLMNLCVKSEPVSLLPIVVVSFSVLAEQLSYGFGFALYLSFLNHTAHREKGKSLMALSLLLGCLVSGPLLQLMGYNAFFVMSLILSVLTLLSSATLRTAS